MLDLTKINDMLKEPLNFPDKTPQNIMVLHTIIEGAINGNSGKFVFVTSAGIFKGTVFAGGYLTPDFLNLHDVTVILAQGPVSHCQSLFLDVHRILAFGIDE